MQAFHNDPALKERVLVALKRHKLLDTLVQGTYWREGKGCAVGCVLNELGGTPEYHEEYEGLLGIPFELASIQDHVFEKLLAEDAREWATDFIQAIPVGKNLLGVWPAILRRTLFGECWKARFERFGVAPAQLEAFIDALVTGLPKDVNLELDYSSEEVSDPQLRACMKLVQCGQSVARTHRKGDSDIILMYLFNTMWESYTPEQVVEIVLTELRKD